jgi:hypothetical protein
VGSKTPPRLCKARKIDFNREGKTLVTEVEEQVAEECAVNVTAKMRIHRLDDRCWAVERKRVIAKGDNAGKVE